MKKILRSIGNLFGAVHVQKNWPDQILRAIGARTSRDFEMRLRCGYVIRGERVDRGTCNEVWIESMYALPVDVRAWKTIVEVGGHIGSTTLYFAHRSPKARIVVFEPSPRNFALLSANVERNGLADRVAPVHMAVDGDAGEKAFHIMPTTGGNSLFAYGDGGETITVRSTTLAEAFAEHGVERCDLLKLDCEGAEYAILYGASDELLSRIDNIVLEYHHFSDDPRANERDLRTFLESKGFAVGDHQKHMLFATKGK